MNVFKEQWFDFLVTYVVFVLSLSFSKAVSPLFYAPALLFAYFLFRSSNLWLFETDFIKGIMRNLLLCHKKLGGNLSSFSTSLAAHMAILFFLYLPALALASRLSKALL